MKRDAPTRLLLGTGAVIVLVNVVLAQLVAQTFHPGVGLQLGPAVLGVLVVAAVACAVYAVRGWRSYMRGGPPE